MRNVVHVCGAVLAVMALCRSAGADLLILENGTRQRGVIVEETPEGYWLETGPRMKVLYERAEVVAVEHESDETNAGLRATWGRRAAARAAESAQKPGEADAQPASRPAGMPSQAAATKPADDEGGLVPKGKRYGFLQGGGFTPGVTTQSEVMGRLGGPDDKGTTADGAPVFYYDAGGGDIYVLSFGRVEGKRQPVLTAMWFVSNVAAERQREENAQAFKETHGW